MPHPGRPGTLLSQQEGVPPLPPVRHPPIPTQGACPQQGTYRKLDDRLHEISTQDTPCCSGFPLLVSPRLALCLTAKPVSCEGSRSIYGSGAGKFVLPLGLGSVNAPQNSSTWSLLFSQVVEEESDGSSNIATVAEVRTIQRETVVTTELCVLPWSKPRYNRPISPLPHPSEGLSSPPLPKSDQQQEGQSYAYSLLLLSAHILLLIQLGTYSRGIPSSPT